MKKLTSVLLTFLIGIPAIGFSESRAYHWAQLQMDQAWSLTKGDPRVKVAILSTGVNYRLAEIPQESIVLNEGESGGGKESDGIDNDGNGYVDDLLGADVFSNTGDVMDQHGLGTYEASLLVSPTFGLAPGVRIIPVRVFDDVGSSTPAHMSRAVEYAVKRGADIILFVGGWSGSGEAFCQAVKSAGSKGILVVVAAGNEGREVTSGDQPATCDAANLVIATATAKEGDLASWANYSFRMVDVAAPGVEIPGFNAFGREVAKSGTGIAATVTAAVAALVKSHRPSHSVLALKEALIRGTDYSFHLAGKVASNGRLNAYKALMVSVR